MMDRSDLGDRIKRYESTSDFLLNTRMPLIIRLDGKGFSKFTKGLLSPYDKNFRACMEYASSELIRKIEGCRFAYTQSDEITLILVDYASNDSEPWFGYRLNKVLSISAAICTAAFIKAALKYIPHHLAKKGLPVFDARAFNVPREDVCNVILWRQQDATRNSIQSLGRAHFSHKQLDKVNMGGIQEMLFSQKGINYNDMPTAFKRGVSLYKINMPSVSDKDSIAIIRKKVVADYEMPILTKDRNYVDRWLEPEPDYDITMFRDTYCVIEDIEFNTVIGID